MKLVMICYNEAIDDSIVEILEQSNIQGYTKWTKVLGKGQTSEPHLLSHTWPKANNVLFTVSPEKNTEELFSRIRKLKTEIGKEGLKAFMWTVDPVN
jgi:hypothetical protein